MHTIPEGWDYVEGGAYHAFPDKPKEPLVNITRTPDDVKPEVKPPLGDAENTKTVEPDPALLNIEGPEDEAEDSGDDDESDEDDGSEIYDPDDDIA